MQNGRLPSRLGHVMAGALGCFFAVTTAVAQDVSDQPLSVVEPPVSATGEAYADTLRGTGITGRVIYSDDPEFGPGQEVRIRRAQRRNQDLNSPSISMNSGWSVGLTVLLMVLALLLWLKFGGSGMLLSREPREVKRGTVPDGWSLAEDAGPIDGRVLISRLRQMADRQQALVLLLRHSLLAAGLACDTRFARADTEREAFARIPTSWGYRPALAEILRTTELAHYGGRSVQDDEFDAAMGRGEAILMAGKGAVHAG